MLFFLTGCGIETLPVASQNGVVAQPPATTRPRPPIASNVSAALQPVPLPTALTVVQATPTQDVPVPVGPASQGARASTLVPTKQVSCPDATGPITAPIVFGEGQGLMMVQPTDQHVVPVVKEPENVTEPENVWAHDPVWSPDGTTLAFTLSQPTVDPDLAWLQVGMVCGLDRATGKGRVLERGTTPLESVEVGAWEPSGHALLGTVHQPQLDAQKNYVSDNIAVIRYDLLTHQRQTLVADAASPVLSPDGKHLLCLHVDATSYAVSLMVSGPDGHAPQTLLPNTVDFASIVAPQWSPDAKSIVFTASGGPTQGHSQTPLDRSWLDTLLGVSVVAAHGLPADVWLIGADGKGLRRLTNKGLDDPRAAWSPNGRQIAFTTGAAGGIWLMDLANLQMRQISEQGHYGGIAWLAH